MNEQDGGQDVAPEAEGEPQADAEEADGETEGHDDSVCPPCEEAEPLRRPPVPKLPSAAEIEDHRRTHIPYRSWCRDCILGRALGEKRGVHAGRPCDIARSPRMRSAFLAERPSKDAISAPRAVGDVSSSVVLDLSC